MYSPPDVRPTNEEKSLRIIGFGAHPDDVELFFLGTLAAAQATGQEIGWVVVTDGSRGGSVDPAKLRLIRRREAEDAGAVLQVSPLFLDRQDGGLEKDPELIGVVEQCIADLSPDLVITHSYNDYHPDHRALSRAVKTAAGFKVPVLYSDTLMGVAFEPTIYVDITAHMETKLRALRKHVSQCPVRFVAACETWNRFRALQCNSAEGYAEAFRFEPSYPYADIRDLLPPPPPRSIGDGEHSGVA